MLERLQFYLLNDPYMRCRLIFYEQFSANLRKEIEEIENSRSFTWSSRNILKTRRSVVIKYKALYNWMLSTLNDSSCGFKFLENFRTAALRGIQFGYQNNFACNFQRSLKARSTAPWPGHVFLLFVIFMSSQIVPSVMDFYYVWGSGPP